MVREIAVETLDKIGGDRAVEGLIAALKDKSPWIHQTAAKALGNFYIQADTIKAISDYINTLSITPENSLVFEYFYTNLAIKITQIDSSNPQWFTTEYPAFLESLSEKELYLFYSFGSFDLMAGFNLLFNELVERIKQKGDLFEWLSQIDPEGLTYSRFLLVSSSRGKLMDLVKIVSFDGKERINSTLKRICDLIQESILSQSDAVNFSYLSNTINEIFNCPDIDIETTNYLKKIILKTMQGKNLKLKVFCILVINNHPRIFKDTLDFFSEEDKPILKIVDYLNKPDYKQLIKEDNTLPILVDFAESTLGPGGSFPGLIELFRKNNEYIVKEVTDGGKIKYIVESKKRISGIKLIFYLVQEIENDEFREAMESEKYSLIFTRHHSFKGRSFGGIGSEITFPVFIGVNNVGEGMINNRFTIALPEELAKASNTNQDWQSIWNKINEKRMSLSNFVPPHSLAFLIPYILNIQNNENINPEEIKAINSVIIIDGGCSGLTRIPEYILEYKEAVKKKFSPEFLQQGSLDNSVQHQDTRAQLEFSPQVVERFNISGLKQRLSPIFGPLNDIKVKICVNYSEDSGPFSFSWRKGEQAFYINLKHFTDESNQLNDVNLLLTLQKGVEEFRGVLALQKELDKDIAQLAKTEQKPESLTHASSAVEKIVITKDEVVGILERLRQEAIDQRIDRFGQPGEQLVLDIKGNPISIYNWYKKLSDEQKKTIEDVLVQFVDITQGSILNKVHYIFIENQDFLNPLSSEEKRNGGTDNINSIILYPNAFIVKSHRVSGVSSLEGTLIHELSHGLTGVIHNEWIEEFGKTVEDNAYITPYAKIETDEDICETMVAVLKNLDDNYKDKPIVMEKIKFLRKIFKLPTQVRASRLMGKEGGKEGGIDLSNIELTLKDEQFVSSLNSADFKILLAAKALKQGLNPLSLLRIHEVLGYFKDGIAKPETIQNPKLFKHVLSELRLNHFLDFKALGYLKLLGRNKQGCIDRVAGYINCSGRIYQARREITYA